MKVYITIASIFVLQACNHTSIYRPVALPAKGTELAKLISQTPVIDIHTHTFNSRFLPIREIALGRRDMSPWFSLVTDSMAIALTELITKATEKDSPFIPSDQQIAYDTNRTLDLMRASGRPLAITLSTVKTQEVSQDPGITGAKKLLTGTQEDDLLPAERRRLEQFSRMFGESHGQIPPFGLFPDKTDHTNETRHFLSCLTAPASRMESLFQSDHTKDKSPQVSLIASHMMDLAPTYDQREDGEKLFDFRTQQIPAMQRQQSLASGRLLYFVAYNPFRDHWQKDPAAGPGQALEIVKRAYTNQGAFGVKVYPPSGYKPSGNSIPFRPFSVAPQPHRQWRARYVPNGVKLTGQELDARLNELYQWCSDYQVPIFTHCGRDEVQARKGYGKLADPAGWRPVLERFPKLRLCLGHAGGGAEWYADGDLTSWGKTVSELCREFENVYCEFGCQDSIADPIKRGAFTRQIQRQIQKNEPNRPYIFSTKILYGSDWFMPMPQSSDRLNHLLAHQTAIFDAGGSELYKNYFNRNSLSYLNSSERIKKPGIPLALRARINALLAH
jgi:predicted TIM-barrel fold metal-dependent hydrolase